MTQEGAWWVMILSKTAGAWWLPNMQVQPCRRTEQPLFHLAFDLITTRGCRSLSVCISFSDSLTRSIEAIGLLLAMQVVDPLLECRHHGTRHLALHLRKHLIVHLIPKPNMNLQPDSSLVL